MSDDNPSRLDETASIPPTPPDGPSDWASVVRPNYFQDIERLGIWNWGVNPVPKIHGINVPSGCFGPVGGGSVGAGCDAVYVVVHGWAPGYLPQVPSDGNLKWWDIGAANDEGWPSAWAWAPVGPPATPPLEVSGTGMLQAIMAQATEEGKKVVALAYSWLDGSATAASDDHWWDEAYVAQYVYQSEAATHVNGLRLANAVQQALSPSFAGTVHLIGHSHGSKVCTVAAQILQGETFPAGSTNPFPIGHLTILDSPESGTPLRFNGANLLGAHLQSMAIQAPDQPGSAGTFIDNHTSYFGVGYSNAVGNVVDVSLNSAPLYAGIVEPDVADQHTYAAAWYAGAALGAQKQGQAAVGLAWPPIPQPYSGNPVLKQTWPGAGNTEANQWLLAGGGPVTPNGSYAYALSGLGLYTGHWWDKTPLTSITLAPNASNTAGWYDNEIGQDQYGLAFDVTWDSPQDGDWLALSVVGDLTYTLLVVDGPSVTPQKKTTFVISADVDATYVYLNFFYASTASDPNGSIQIENFQKVIVTSD